jgi:hypothetical protein
MGINVTGKSFYRLAPELEPYVIEKISRDPKTNSPFEEGYRDWILLARFLLARLLPDF